MSEHASAAVSDRGGHVLDLGSRTRGGPPLAEQIYARLRRAIVFGAIGAGEPLREPNLAKELGVSRTPVREALLRLRDDGLVDIRPQSGTSVTHIARNAVEEGILVRDSLEPRVAELAASRITEDELLELERQTTRMARALDAKDSVGFIEADDQFHRTLIEASGFPNLAQMIERVSAPLDRLRYKSASEIARSRLAVDEHWALIDTLRREQPKESARQLSTHLRGSWQLIRKLAEETDEADR